MALVQAVGAKVGFSSSPAAVFTSTAFTALTYTDVGSLQSMPELDGTYDVASFDDLTLGTEVKFSDMMRAGEGSFMVGLDSSDTGQTAIETAKGSKGAFKFELKDGTKYYRNAIILSYKPTGVEVGSIVMAEIAVAFEGKSIKGA